MDFQCMHRNGCWLRMHVVVTVAATATDVAVIFTADVVVFVHLLFFICHFILFSTLRCVFFFSSRSHWTEVIFCTAAAAIVSYCVYVCIHCGLECAHNLMTNIKL